VPDRRARTVEVPIDKLDQPELPLARKDGGVTLAQLERDSILGVLEESNWLIAGPRGAAARLGMKRTTLQSLLKRLEISRPVLSPS
jgi:formate hydrogenlyase transcriptional activator